MLPEPFCQVGILTKHPFSEAIEHIAFGRLRGSSCNVL